MPQLDLWNAVGPDLIENKKKAKRNDSIDDENDMNDGTNNGQLGR